MSKIEQKKMLVDGFDNEDLLSMLMKLEDSLSEDKNVELNLQSDGSGRVNYWTFKDEKEIFEFETIEQLYKQLKERTNASNR